MGVIFEYFAAATDDAAVELIDAEGGPGGPMPPSPALQEALRSRDREAIRRAMRPKLRESDAGVLVVGTKGVDPIIHLGALEELLTGDAYDEITTRPRCGQVLADRHDGEVMLVTLTDELLAALARATPDQLVALAGPWSGTEGFSDGGDPEVLGHLLLAFGDLARQASQRGERLYCWIAL